MPPKKPAEIFTAYITKYALTQSILVVQARVCEHFTKPGTMIEVAPFHNSVYFHGNDWHRDKNDAVNRAAEMLRNKIKSVEKQLGRLRLQDEDVNWPRFVESDGG